MACHRKWTSLCIVNELSYFDKAVSEHGGFLKVKLGGADTHLLIKLLLQELKLLKAHGLRIL